MTAQNISFAVDPYTQIFNAMKSKVPVFDGHDPEGWLSQIERLFDSYNAPEEWRLRLISYHMEGEADDWLLSSLANNQLLTWPGFRFQFQQRFGFSAYDSVFKRLMKDVDARIEKLGKKISISSPSTPPTVTTPFLPSPLVLPLPSPSETTHEPTAQPSLPPSALPSPIPLPIERTPFIPLPHTDTLPSIATVNIIQDHLKETESEATNLTPPPPLKENNEANVDALNFYDFDGFKDDPSLSMFRMEQKVFDDLPHLELYPPACPHSIVLPIIERQEKKISKARRHFDPGGDIFYIWKVEAVSNLFYVFPYIRNNLVRDDGCDRKIVVGIVVKHLLGLPVALNNLLAMLWLKNHIICWFMFSLEVENSPKDLINIEYFVWRQRLFSPFLSQIHFGKSSCNDYKWSLCVCANFMSIKESLQGIFLVKSLMASSFFHQTLASNINVYAITELKKVSCGFKLEVKIDNQNGGETRFWDGGNPTRNQELSWVFDPGADSCCKRQLTSFEMSYNLVFSCQLFGMAVGKGVIVVMTMGEVFEVVDFILVKNVLGSTGYHVTIEEYLNEQHTIGVFWAKHQRGNFPARLSFHTSKSACTNGLGEPIFGEGISLQWVNNPYCGGSVNISILQLKSDSEQLGYGYELATTFCNRSDGDVDGAMARKSHFVFDPGGGILEMLSLKNSGTRCGKEVEVYLELELF